MAGLMLGGRKAGSFRRAQVAASKRLHLRSDIQGLRAFAVIAVILDHLLHWPSGGFVGVDIFFVISGFVITESLLREQERTGRISFSAFYMRRVKRILPVSTLVLVITVAASFLTYNQSRFISVASDAVWALFFSGNWHFAAAGTDYFQSGGPVSPLQHYWSLAVEEQFYFVWPWVMLLIFALFSRRSNTGTAPRIAVGAAITVICAASFFWAVRETAAAPTVAYFSTLSRAWELGIGAFIGVIAPVLVRIPAALRPGLAWVGVIGMVASLFAINGSNQFPAPSAALPVFSAALFILAGTGSSKPRFLSPFTNSVSGYLGNISYSLYLWHFPAIGIVSAFLDESPLYYLVAGLGGLVIAAYSYHLVEDPIRKSNWLTPWKAPREGPRVSKSYKLTALSLLVLTAACVAVPALLPKQAPVSALPLPVTSGATKAAAENLSPAIQEMQEAIALSLNSPTWPQHLSPSLDDPKAATSPEMASPDCLNPTDPSDTDICTSGAGVKTAMVVGDSIAASWVPTIRAALAGKGYTLHTVTFSGCPYIQAEIGIPDKPAPSKKCNDARALINQQIAELRPDLVFISSAVKDFSSLQSGRRAEAAIPEWTAATVASIRLAREAGAQVVLIAPNPEGKSVEGCATRTSAPADCAGGVPDLWFPKAQAEEAAAKAAGALFVDPRTWMCSPDGVCPMFIREHLVRWDNTHLTEPFATSLGPLLLEAISPLLAE